MPDTTSHTLPGTDWCGREVKSSHYVPPPSVDMMTPDWSQTQ